MLSQKEMPNSKAAITILVKYSFSINKFEKALEECFSNINILQVGNFTSNSAIDEYEARLEHDDLTDIIMTWPLETGESY